MLDEERSVDIGPLSLKVGGEYTLSFKKSLITAIVGTLTYIGLILLFRVIYAEYTYIGAISSIILSLCAALLVKRYFKYVEAREKREDVEDW